MRENPLHGPPGLLRLASAVLAILAFAVEPTGAQDEARLLCSARLVGDRVLLSVELRRFLDEESLRLVRLGLVGRIHVEAGVYRRKWGLFEKAVATSRSDAEIAFDGAPRGFSLGRRPLHDPAVAVSLPVQSIRLRSDPQAGPLSVRVEVRLQVVTVASLSKVATWATGSEQEGPSDVLTRGLLSAVVEDLTRSSTCACGVELPPEKR